MSEYTIRANGTFRRSLNSPHYRQSNQGLTLIELLIVISVVMIITGIGVPNLSKWRDRTVESTLFSTLNHLCALARTRAIRDNRPFTLCASNDLRTCNGEWNETIIVFSDQNTNEVVDPEDIIYKALTLPKNTPCVEWNAGAYRPYLQFKPSGATNGTAGHFKFCDQVNSSFEKKLVVSFAGRTSLKYL